MVIHMPEPDLSPDEHEYDDDPYYDDEYEECYWCGGEGWVEALEQESDSWNWGPDDLVRCASCGGSGLAKDMTIW